MAVEMTLAEKVYAMVAAEDNAVGDQAAVPGLELTRGFGRFELDLRDWGIAYGIALGIARAEEPCEPLTSVAERAAAAAAEAYKRWGGDVAPPADCINPLVDAVLRAHGYECRCSDHELRDAVIELGNTLGWPRETESVA
ncbi:MAG: hypothetical protein M3065_21765 [Actinomycetota bacterium]|nr:hypothetical protein [Actinomycetota bacterium]